MPEKLKNMLYPSTYQPWYVYDATITPRAAQKIWKFDVVVPGTDQSKYIHPADLSTPLVADNHISLHGGYAVCLETIDAGDSDVVAQVAMPGSLIPAVAEGVISQGELVVAHYLSDADGMVVVPGDGADFASGYIFGRARVQFADRAFLSATGVNDKDVVLVQTGVC